MLVSGKVETGHGESDGVGVLFVDDDELSTRGKVNPLERAGPSGMEDVLLTSAELLASDSGAAVRACAGKGGCKVTSLRGASIDALLPAAAAIGGNAQEGAWSFRCARDVQ